jgi:uncharacterized repeat protein (TIGR04138 family)
VLCEKCHQREATQTTTFTGRETNLCDVCFEPVLERVQGLAEEYGAVARSSGDLISEIVAEDSRFNEEAYEFVVEAWKTAFVEWCSTTSAELGGVSPATWNDEKMPSKRLVVTLQRLASERFGKCATATFNSWGITCWQDFAEVVSRMQEAKASLFHLLALNRDDFKSRGVLDDVFPER